MFREEWRRWLQRLMDEVSLRSAHRRRHGAVSEVAAEITAGESLESRLLLSASSATHLVFTVQPTNTTAGTSFSVTVSVEDSSGNVVTTNDSTIRLTVQGHGRFAGDGRTMTATASDGVAMFNDLTLDKAGTYTLEATIGHRHRVTSDSFVVSPDTSGPEQLAFLATSRSTGPSTSRCGQSRWPSRTSSATSSMLKGVEERVFPVGRLDYMSEGTSPAHQRWRSHGAVDRRFARRKDLHGEGEWQAQRRRDRQAA